MESYLPVADENFKLSDRHAEVLDKCVSHLTQSIKDLETGEITVGLIYTFSDKEKALTKLCQVLHSLPLPMDKIQELTTSKLIDLNLHEEFQKDFESFQEFLSPYVNTESKF